MAESWTLSELRWHYGEAYEITDRPRWRAKRRDGKGEPIVADSAAELVALLREDYRRDPVSRDAD
jgi:hypothetical protein